MTMSKSKFVGVDGCPYGWFSVGLDNCEGYEVQVFKTLEGGEGRDCDHEARKLLGRPRGSSVFPTPTRPTVNQAAKSPGDYRGAVEIERCFAGKGINKQTFAIAPKIAEVDKVLLDRDASAPPPVREVHPEVCFWALHNRQPMNPSKKKKEGRDRRLSVLQGIEPRTKDIYNCALKKYLRKQVARDDILDALAAAVTAKLGWPNDLRTLPECPPTDCNDLPMEMVYVRPDKRRPIKR